MAKTNSFHLEALDREGWGLRAVFPRAGVRFSETILAIGASGARPLLQSNSTTPWQEIVCHVLADSRQALLLTGAGEGQYWSATISPITDVHYALLGYDLACRRRRESAMPAISYEIPDGVAIDQREGCVILSVDGRDFMLSGVAMPTSIATESIDTARLHLDGRRISIEALGAPHVSTRETVQWRFELSAMRPQ